MKNVFVMKSSKEFKFSKKGLTISEKNSLNEAREDVPSDCYLIALFSKEEKQVYFVNESSYSNDERCELVY